VNGAEKIDEEEEEVVKATNKSKEKL